MEAWFDMQSSAGTVCRALVMLVFLAGIPLVAVSGTCWPQVAQRLHAKWQDFGLPPIAMLTSFASSPPSSEAPRFEPPSGVAHAPVESAQKPGAALPSKSNAPLVLLAPPGSASAASKEAPRGNPSSLGDALNAQTAPANRNGISAEPPHASRTSEDQYAYVQERLRELGATHYQLESWSNEPPLYRFCCKMAIGGNASYTRYFEATHANAVQAMNLVLDQVETWRSGGELRADTLTTDHSDALASR